jgi:hypothetical protein
VGGFQILEGVSKEESNAQFKLTQERFIKLGRRARVKPRPYFAGSLGNGLLSSNAPVARDVDGLREAVDAWRSNGARAKEAARGQHRRLADGAAFGASKQQVPELSWKSVLNKYAATRAAQEVGAVTRVTMERWAGRRGHDGAIRGCCGRSQDDLIARGRVHGTASVGTLAV